MSVGAILTLGFGSFGSVNLLPTLGYGESVTPPTPTPGTSGVGKGKKRKVVVRFADIESRETTAEFLKAQLRVRHPDSAFAPDQAPPAATKSSKAQKAKDAALAAEAMRAMQIEAQNEERRIIDDTEIILKLIALSSL